ncbi:agmatine deiminase family protein [Porphyromonas loveana]|uniref:agmatine deiminase family protein n=1 Tax=Porphyromonas loveana TaxID=1884669 RepID=UPI0035A0B9C3
MTQTLFLPEWAPQEAVQLTWPHAQSDWAYMLDEVETCFVRIATAVLRHERLIVVAPDSERIFRLLPTELHHRLTCFDIPSNDTWARDHGGISLLRDGRPTVADFTFNGWGQKFAANYDNCITRELHGRGAFAADVSLRNELSFVLEGGALETDGAGTLLTTDSCIFERNRNAGLSRTAIIDRLKVSLGVDRVLSLRHGHLAGDDTDGHIDTLARFVNPHTITYVRCDDATDPHHSALAAMEEELKSFRQANGDPYTLVPLPMAEAVYEGDERLPATYANFLIINGAVLVPTYASERDAAALDVMEGLFPDRAIIGIDCRPLIKQHGSLHCVTMQYPQGFIR